MTKIVFDVPGGFTPATLADALESARDYYRKHYAELKIISESGSPDAARSAATKMRVLLRSFPALSKLTDAIRAAATDGAR